MLDHRKAFYKFYETYMQVDIDPAFPVIKEIFRRYELSYEQQLWAVFLYTAFYNSGSVFLVMQEFPDYEKVDLPRLSRWLRRLSASERIGLFQKDRRWYARPSKQEPNKFQFETLVESYFATLQHPKPQAALFQNVVTAKDAFSRIRRVKGIGRHAALAYVETMIRCMDVQLQPFRYIDIAEQESHQGYAYFAGADALSSKQAADLVDNLMPELQKRFPNITVDAMYMETVGCAFRKLVEGRVYLGFYLDRQAEEISNAAALPLACGVHWDTLWEIRRELFPARYLGGGINKQWLGVYKRTGQILNQLEDVYAT